MYIPKHHEETDTGVLHALIRAHPLGAWATLGNDELVVNHVPFLLDTSRTKHGTLRGHIARANPAWQLFSKAIPSIVIFQGPEAYISPSWYPSKQVHGRAVPTWNYAIVHVHGVPVVIEDKEWLLAHLNKLTDVHEADKSLPWKVSDAPVDYINQMVDGIIGIEIPIVKIVGKWKVSQNRSEPDRVGVVAGLLEQDSSQAKEMAVLVGSSLANSKND